MADVAEHRRKWLDEQLGDWSAAELDEFVTLPRALQQRPQRAERVLRRSQTEVSGGSRPSSSPPLAMTTSPAGSSTGVVAGVEHDGEVAAAEGEDGGVGGQGIDRVAGPSACARRAASARR